MTVIDAINQLGVDNKGKNDKESHKLIQQVIKAMDTKNSKWPSKDLCKIVHKLDEHQKMLFRVVLGDMDEALTYAYGVLETQEV